jgi:hypothetical protein
LKYIFLFFFTLLLIYLSCTEKKQAESDFTKNDSTLITISGLDSAALEAAPEWFKNIPESDTVYYAAATAKSSRANIARDKAIMKAQVELAAKLRSAGSPKGADAGDDTSDELDEVIKNVITSKQTQIQEGRLWRVYVLLEMRK